MPVTIPAHQIPSTEGVLCSGGGVGGIGNIGGVAFAEANIGSCGLWDNGGNIDTAVTIHVRMQFLSNETACLNLLACASEAVGDRTDLGNEGPEENKGGGILPSTDGSGGATTEGGSNTGNSGSTTSDKQVVIDENKFRYVFGEATGSRHNLDRSNGLALQTERLGVLDNPDGISLLVDNLLAAALDDTNVISTRTNQWGTFLEKESLFAGPSGKFALFRSDWKVGDNGLLQFSSLKILGG